jgi:hypothetical protein
MAVAFLLKAVAPTLKAAKILLFPAEFLEAAKEKI